MIGSWRMKRKKEGQYPYERILSSCFMLKTVFIKLPLYESHCQKAISNRFCNRLDIAFCFYPAISPICESIFSIKTPSLLVGSFTIARVTAPMSLPSWMMGEPLTSVVNKGQRVSGKILRNRKKCGGILLQFKFYAVGGLYWKICAEYR